MTSNPHLTSVAILGAGSGCFYIQHKPIARFGQEIKTMSSAILNSNSKINIKGPYINDVSRVRGEGGSQFLTKGREVL